MIINKISLLSLIFILLGCTSIQSKRTPTNIPIPTNTKQSSETEELLSVPTILPETKITAISAENKITLKGFQGYISWLVWSKNGKTLFVGTEKSGVIVYDLEHKEIIANFDNNLPSGSVIQDLALSPDEKTLAMVIYGEDFLRLVNPENGELLRTIKTGTNWHGSLVFSPDNSMLASIKTNDKKILLWDVAIGKEVRQLTYKNYGFGKTWFTSDGQSLITYSEGNTFVFWDTKTWELQKTFHCESSGFTTVSPDGSTFVVIGAEDKTEENSIWDFKSCKKLSDLSGAQPWILAITYEPNGKYVAVGGSGGTDRIIHKITLWDVKSGRHVRDLITGYYAVTVVLAFSPDGTRLASGGYAPDGTNESEIIVWDISQP